MIAGLVKSAAIVATELIPEAPAPSRPAAAGAAETGTDAGDTVIPDRVDAPGPAASGAHPDGRAVPHAVCGNCPICQGAAYIDELNPEILADLAHVARSLAAGLVAAMGAAAEHRATRPFPPRDGSGASAGPSKVHRNEPAKDAETDTPLAGEDGFGPAQ